MLNLKRMRQEATPSSLVLVDEMGTGTAPEEGAALAVALLEEFRKKHCFVLATTHHDRLKSYASTTPGVVNAAVEFDDVNLRPTYQLMVGVPGGSSGIAIAQRLGLAKEIIEHARSLMAPESQEAAELIAYLHRSRDELDRLREQMNEIVLDRSDRLARYGAELQHNLSVAARSPGVVLEVIMLLVHHVEGVGGKAGQFGVRIECHPAATRDRRQAWQSRPTPHPSSARRSAASARRALPCPPYRCRRQPVAAP